MKRKTQMEGRKSVASRGSEYSPLTEISAFLLSTTIGFHFSFDHPLLILAQGHTKMMRPPRFSGRLIHDPWSIAARLALNYAPPLPPPSYNGFSRVIITSRQSDP